MALTDSLVESWELDEASGNAIGSHAGLDLTETSGTIGASTGPGGVGGSRDFEAGDSEYFTRADEAALSTGNIDFTLEAWVNLETTSGTTQILVSKDDVGAGGREHALYASSSRFNFGVSNNGTAFVAVGATTFGAPSTGTWHQVIAWHDATANTINICVNDGTVDSTAHTTGVFDSAAPFRLGVHNSTPANYLDGLLSKVRFWKRVLTSGERTQLYNSGSGLAYSAFGGGGGFVAFPRPRGARGGMLALAGGMH